MSGLTLHIPRLETERLWLRPPQASDYEACVAFMGSERAAFVGGPMTDPSELRRFFGHIPGMWVLRGYGPFMMERKSDGRLLGLAALWNPMGWPEPELGWAIWEAEGEGQGLAFEAALRARDYAREAHGLTGLVSYIAPGNDRSVALAERLGARPDSAAARPKPEALVYRHPVEPKP